MSSERITLNMNLNDMLSELSDGNPGAIRVLFELFDGGRGLMDLLWCDTKRLYGPDIWRLYKDVCDEDIERFRYHLCIELPNQETGRLSITGPYSTRFDDGSAENKTFWESRKYGQPNSFWALEKHPRRGYSYPLNCDGSEVV